MYPDLTPSLSLDLARQLTAERLADAERQRRTRRLRRLRATSTR